jgi:lysophospholipase L1-like esterase
MRGPWTWLHRKRCALVALVQLGAAAGVLTALLTTNAVAAAPESAAGVQQPLAIVDTSAATRTVTCVGDSLTAGFPYQGTQDQYTYPARLSVLLQSFYGAGSFEVINRGKTGYPAHQVLTSMIAGQWMALDNPEIVLLMVGGNDLWQEFLRSGDRDAVIANATADVQAIVDEVTRHVNPDGQRPKVIVSAFPPNRLFDDYGSETVNLYNQSLHQHLTGLDLWTWDNWTDVYDPTSGMARADLMWLDATHLNADGYAVVAQNWFEAIQRLTSLTRRAYLPVVLKD